MDDVVLNLAGLDDGGGGDDGEGDRRKGNPRKRVVKKAERKGRHRGWAGKRADMVGEGRAGMRRPAQMAPHLKP
jgi:hypothetical protein